MDALEDWLIDQGLAAARLAPLLDGFCARLAEAGVPLMRGHLSLSVVDPLVSARSHTWMIGKGVVSNDILHEGGPDKFAFSPFAAMMRDNVTLRRWMLDRSAQADFAVLDDVAAMGGQDYLGILHPFRSPDFEGLRGVGFAFSSDRPGGFDDQEIARILRLTRLAATAVYRITLRDIAVALMDAYVGPPASRRILNGQIRRGSGEPIEAVLLMADLVGFTSVADASGIDLIERLDEHLEAMASPVVKRGGSVLKFIGDAILAVFPVNDAVSKATACRLALDAAIEAIAANEQVNRRRPAQRPLHLDVALNYGNVFYGNVGAPSRLDFTVIGPAVNAVARIEALCGPLERNLLIADDVAQGLDVPTLSLGRHALRGIEGEREIFTPAERIGERGRG